MSIATFVSVTSPADAMSMPAPMSGQGPNFGRSFVDLLVAAMMIVPVIGRNAKPVWIGEKSRFCCR